MKYLVLALIIGLIVFKVFFSSKDPASSPQIQTPQEVQPASPVPTSGGGSDQTKTTVAPSDSTPETETSTPENPQAGRINPANRIMIDQASPASSGTSAGVASQVTRPIGVGAGSPLNQAAGVKLDPSSFLQDQGSHAKIFGNENGGGSPEAKGLAPGGASALPLDNGSPVLRDKSSLTIEATN